MGKHRFYHGGKFENFKVPFLARKNISIWVYSISKVLLLETFIFYCRNSIVWYNLVFYRFFFFFFFFLFLGSDGDDLTTLYQKMQNCNIWGECFLRKFIFPIFSWENQDFQFLRLQWSSIVISKIWNLNFLMKILKKSTFLRKYTPTNVAIQHLLV